MEKTIYIAGKMRGIPEYNHPAFYAAEERLLKEGKYKVVNPARMDNEAEGEFNPREALKRDMVAICEKCTAIYMLRGWETSSGAAAEYNLAVSLDLELLFEPSPEKEKSYLCNEDYPHYCCRSCGQKALLLPENQGKKQYRVSTWYTERCGVCNKKKTCTEVRDFQYPDFTKLMEQKQNG